jgi:cell division protein FtsW
VNVLTAEREKWRMSVEARALVVLTAVIMVFGLASLYSASAIVAMGENRHSAYYLLRQVTGVIVGAGLFALAAKTDAEKWRKWAWPIMILSIVLMLVTVLPFTESIAPRINGSRRFLFGASVQPSELAKLAVIVWTSMLVIRKGDTLRRLTKGLLPFLVVIGILDVLAVLEPDLSTALLFTLVMAVILFTGGARIGHFILLGCLAVPVLWQTVERLQYVLLRLASFRNADAAAPQLSYQLKQSLIAVGTGGFFGVGFGHGRQQYGFLPLPFNDFIASNIGEEWGFLGLAGIVVAFAAYAYLGFRIARNARTPFQQLVAVGLTTTIVVTAYLHIGVVIGLLPTTGLTLPFVSYGRSNLVLSLLMTGILANIGSAPERVAAKHGDDSLALAA